MKKIINIKSNQRIKTLLTNSSVFINNSQSDKAEFYFSKSKFDLLFFQIVWFI